MNAMLEACEPSARYLSALEPPLLQQFDLIASASNGMARLRELILTLAMQGKLVPQNANEEPASELINDIGSSRHDLKTKRISHLDTQYCPFTVPSSWQWVRFDSLFSLEYGDNLPAPKRSNTGEFPVYGSNGVVGSHSECSVRSPCIIVGRKGSAGALNLCLEPGCWVTDVAYYCVPPKELDLHFCFKLFHTLGLDDLGKGIKPGLSRSEAYVIPVAIPPLAEQTRIVARVEELMDFCDALEAKGKLEAEQHARLVGSLFDSLTNSESAHALAENWQRIATHFDLLLDRPSAVDALEQTILQLAVRGLLVPQDHADEPASTLLQKIRNEKDHLVAAGRIKRDKPLPAIRDEDKPFELPEGWEWARFPELGEFGRGKSKHRPRNDPRLFNPGKYPLVQTGEVARADQVISEYHSKYSEEGLAQSKMWPEGTLCITIAANIADTAMLGFDACFPDSVVGFVPSPIIGNTEYFLAFMATARARLLEFAPATAQKNINLEILSSVLIPIPPVREMKEIVSRIIELRVLCADLRERLGTVQQTQSRLAETLVESVVA